MFGLCNRIEIDIFTKRCAVYSSRTKTASTGSIQERDVGPLRTQSVKIPPNKSPSILPRMRFQRFFQAVPFNLPPACLPAWIEGFGISLRETRRSRERGGGSKARSYPHWSNSNSRWHIILDIRFFPPLSPVFLFYKSICGRDGVRGNAFRRAYCFILIFRAVSVLARRLRGIRFLSTLLFYKLHYLHPQNKWVFRAKRRDAAPSSQCSFRSTNRSDPQGISRRPLLPIYFLMDVIVFCTAFFVYNFG